MKEHVSDHFIGSIRRACLSGSIAALLTGMAMLAAGSAVVAAAPPSETPVVPVAPAPPATFWLGQTNGLWTQQNWASNALGAPTTATPAVTADITFSAAKAQNQTTTLGGGFTINSLTINDPVAVTINGAPTVGGSAVSSNTLTITGTSAITVNGDAGLLTINAKVALPGASATIAVNNTAGAIINGVISGSGSLTKTGSGSLDLTAANTYTGNTIVSGGTLLVDGSIVSPNLTVQPGATIGGHGTIGGALINGGVVSPGNSPGTLTVGGNYTQSSSGTLLIQIGGAAASQHDLLAVGGVATLGGTLQLQQLNNFKLLPGEQVTFLTAGGGVSGQFATVINPFTSTSPLIGVGVVFDPSAVSVEAVQLPITSLPGETHNERVVAFALDQVLFDPRFAGIISRLDSESLDQVLNDLNNFGPEILTSIFEIAVSDAKVQNFNLERRLEDVRWGSNGFSASGFTMTGNNPGGPVGDTGLLGGPDGKTGKTALAPAPNNRWGFFITGVGEFTSLGDTFNARGYDLTNAGFTLGADYRFTDHLVIGLAAGYDHSQVDPNVGGRITADGGKLALYGTCFDGKGFYTNFAVRGGYDSYDTARPGVGGTARATMEGGQFDALFGTGYDWKIGALTIGPTANFEYTYIGLDSASERGSLAPLNFPSQSQGSIRTTIGAKASYDWKIGGVTVIPELRLGWQHEYGDNTFEFESQFQQGGPFFTVQGPATGRDSLILGAGFSVRWNERVSTYVYYDGELGRANYESNNVSGGFRIEF